MQETLQRTLQRTLQGAAASPAVPAVSADKELLRVATFGRALLVRGLVLALMLFLMLTLAFSLGVSKAYASPCPSGGASGGEHDFVATIIEYATEDTNGTRLIKCVNCGYEEVQMIPATGHAWQGWIVDAEPTCTTEGLQHRTCAKNPASPHTEYTAIPPLSPTGAHEYVLVNKVDSTCTEAGVALHACRYCGQPHEEVLALTGHEWGMWSVTLEPTEEHQGERTRICLFNSLHIETEVLPALLVAVVDTAEVAPVAAPLVPVVLDAPAVEVADVSAEHNFWSFEPNVVDAVAVSFMGLVALVFAAASFSSVMQLLWVRERRKEALSKALDLLAQGRAK